MATATLMTKPLPAHPLPKRPLPAGWPRERYESHNRRLKAMRLAIALLDTGVYRPEQAHNRKIRSTAAGHRGARPVRHDLPSGARPASTTTADDAAGAPTGRPAPGLPPGPAARMPCPPCRGAAHPPEPSPGRRSAASMSVTSASASSSHCTQNVSRPIPARSTSRRSRSSGIRRGPEVAALDLLVLRQLPPVQREMAPQLLVEPGPPHHRRPPAAAAAARPGWAWSPARRDAQRGQLGPSRGQHLELLLLPPGRLRGWAAPG